MIVPEYWAEARVQQRTKGRQVTVRRFGWSDVSQADAQANAETRVRDAFDRIMAGEKIARREHKLAYNGAEGLPIREQIVGRHGESVITRNAYGARCLNTPDVLFADIDFDSRPSPAQRRTARLALLPLAIAFCWFIAYGRFHSLHFGPLMIALLVVPPLWLSFATALAERVHQRSITAAGGPEHMARQRIEQFLKTHPDWHLRLYRTPAGLRLLALHRRFEPGETEVSEFFEQIGCDPAYTRMCRNQRCFRARLSPKPWRIGMRDRLRPRPGVWPVKAEHLPGRIAWIDRYEKKSTAYAACRFITALGSATTDPAAIAIQALHDTQCQALRDLPLA